MAVLIAAGDRSVPLLEPILIRDAIEDRQEAEIRRLIQDLDNDDFFTRESASKELRALGESAVSALKEELKKNPPLEVVTRIEDLLKSSNRAVKMLSGEGLRRIRAIEVLAKIGTDKARELLEQVAKGPESTLESHEAALALKRLQRMKASR